MAEDSTKKHDRFIREFDKIQEAQQEGRELSLQERRFVSISGAQWEGKWGAQFENKVKLEVNKILLSLIRIYNEYRNNRITADFVSRKGDESDELADTLDGLYRADKEDSSAEEAYDNAFDEGTSGGFGAVRLRAVFEDEEDEDSDYQRTAFEPITDADKRVYFDLGAKRQDKADAKRCYVLTSLTPEDYKEEWGEDPATLAPLVDQSEFDWATQDVVWIAEVYEIEMAKKVVFDYEMLDGEEKRFTDKDFEADETLRDKLEATGAVLTREKAIKRKRVHKYIISGAKILEDCGQIAGPNIPVIPYYGKRWFIDGIERYMGHVRPSKDMQRVKNVEYSKLMEISARTDMEKPIFTPEQINNHATRWAEDNIKNYPYLTIDPITGIDGSEIPAGPIGYTKASQIPPSLAALMQLSETDLQDILGNQQNGEKIVSNVSEGAVERIQDALGMQTFIYISNFGKMEKRVAEVWLGMNKELLVEEDRELKTIGSQGEVGNITINQRIIDPDTKAERFKNDIKSANHDISITIGPSSSSRKMSITRELTDLMSVTTDPQDMKILSAMRIMNMDGEGMSDFKEFYRKQMAQLGVVEPTESEEQEMAEAAQNQPPDPNTTLANALSAEAEAKAQLAQANTVKALADAEKIKAETVETLAGIDRDDREQVIKTVEALQKATTQPESMSAIKGEANVGS